jgi:DBP10CT (NUC160) domain
MLWYLSRHVRESVHRSWYLLYGASLGLLATLCPLSSLPALIARSMSLCPLVPANRMEIRLPELFQPLTILPCRRWIIYSVAAHVLSLHAGEIVSEISICIFSTPYRTMPMIHGGQPVEPPSTLLATRLWPSRNNWDKKKKKFVKGNGTGANNVKLVRTENGTRLPATYRSGRFDE